MRKQKGIVLFFTLIILLIMTVIGVALAVNSTQSLRMAGAGAERIEAQAIAGGGLNETIASNKGAALANMVAVITVTSTLGSQQILTPMPKDGTIQDVSCQRSTKASAANLISCRRIEISSNASFGREDLGQLSVVAGIEQEVLTGS
ncbi:pilus assembly protein PilX [Shewanella baltica]|jgi:type IV pilus assembly protein PilX|uniref:pilus assembly PilX family protein n=1 Tax=Shewanella baltica TaxID=62322 RepID=UPI00217E7A93|nr:pilus assembly PilX N-terminal domain-containing protein [Shewanella baltica]MCS6098027.1 pilus assembly protein PilX [Shewanella baltica]MCS6102047.1 pilus assembly protein PilX [Shewanella baltica]MCS6117343.1 pilus assembly protein PilX [Shewanella baltica]MCS6135106.1 pilus assembly protein PilX [Shewanella baltica]MCS6151963.1 pilus assembly protein PilX [Shewanella baltica]